MKHIVVIPLFLFVSFTALAQSYSDASLQGNYSVQFGTPQTYSWSKTFTCPYNSQVKFTASGSQTSTSDAYGVLTFDGKGSVSLSATQIGKENSTASANTMSVKWNTQCQVINVNSGHLVYEKPGTLNGTGTYSVQSNGTGSLTIGSGRPLTFLLAGTNSSGLSSTALLTSTQVDGKSNGTGIAVHQ